MSNKPNVLFVFSDQQRWDTCGCYGQPLDVSPNLDRLAREGVRFQNAFTCQPVCGPARACLQTGKYATEVGCHVNHRMLLVDEKTIAHYLGDAGYQTAYVGKWHLASCGPRGGPDDFRTRPVPVERRGGYRDYWVASDVLEFTSHAYDGHMFDGKMNKVEFPEGRYRADAVSDYAIDFLRTRDSERPFFLFVSYIEPHHQNDHNRYEGPHGSRERFGDFAIPGDLVDTDGDWRENYPDYLGAVNSIDTNLGRFVDELERQGIADNTLIVYTSDHGSHFRTRNSEYKRSCHDGCTHIPLVIAGPGFRGGNVPTGLVSLMDLPPTVLAAAGLDMPSGMRGRPLQPLTQGAPADWSGEVFMQISESQVGRAIRTARWKYSVHAPDRHPVEDSGSDRYVEECLYDLEVDPHERDNLVNRPEYADIRAELAQTLKRRMREAGETVPEIVPATDR